MNAKVNAIAAALLVSCASAEATTKQTFPGTMCESYYNANSPYGKDVYHSGGAIKNYSTSYPAYVDCAVPRANGLSSGTVNDLEVSVTDSTGTMFCSAYTKDRFGNVVGSKTLDSVGAGDRILDFGPVSGAPYEGFIYVFCALPANRSEIHSISVDIGE